MQEECLSSLDPEIYSYIKQEEKRQKGSLNLIASENFTPVSVLQANASVLTNKYSEGYPGKRYYGGTQYIDKIETLCQQRALELFKLDKNEWGVNVQALSGSSANLAVYTALIGPNGKILGMDLPSGGHLTHGYQSKTKKISASSLFFQSYNYKVDKDNLLNYDDIKSKFEECKPDIFVCGYSAYSRDIDYHKIRNIVGDKFLMADIAHISGLVATGLLNSPFEYCDVVTMTTHKTLRGPRGALIFYRKNVTQNGVKINLEEKINFAVFPCLQGGPHNNAIAGIAVALKIARSEDYRNYCKQIVKNSQAMADELIRLGYKVLTGGTDNHMVIIDMTNYLSGSEAELVCERANIIINKNATPDSTSPFNPKGARLGTPALTTRGLNENDFVYVTQLFNRAIQIGVKVKDQMKEGETFSNLLDKNVELSILRTEVLHFVNNIPISCFKFETNK